MHFERIEYVIVLSFLYNGLNNKKRLIFMDTNFILGILVGSALAFILFTVFNSRKKLHEEVAKELENTQEALKLQHQHFSESEELLHKIAGDFTELYRHMSKNTQSTLHTKGSGLVLDNEELLDQLTHQEASEIQTDTNVEENTNEPSIETDEALDNQTNEQILSDEEGSKDTESEHNISTTEETAEIVQEEDVIDTAEITEEINTQNDLEGTENADSEKNEDTDTSENKK